MMAAVLVISIVLFIICFIIDNKCGGVVGAIAEIMEVVFGIAALLSAVLSLGLLISMSYDLGVNDTIVMYQEENAAIEEQIGQLVENYMDYETDTFSNLKGESSIVLISMYPELKSDKLVEAQIDAYMDNSKEIKHLKETAIGLSKSKWLLYFGK